MKSKDRSTFPTPSLREIEESLPKSETIHLRVSSLEKEEVRSVATSMNLSITEYLLKCHAVVAHKLKKD